MDSIRRKGRAFFRLTCSISYTVLYVSRGLHHELLDQKEAPALIQQKQRIRSDLLAAPFLNQLNPNRTDTDPSTRHTLHCIDYLRQAVMCNGDMTLVSTGEDLEFDHSPPRQCRDFGAMSAWVMRHAWNYERWSGLRSLGGPHAGSHTVG